MKRPLLLLPLGLAAGLLAFAAVYWLTVRDHRAMLRDPQSELAWLRTEFGLSDDQFNRVAALHAEYQPVCADFCRRIAESNARLRNAILKTNALNPELRGALEETGRLRDACREAMLAHLYDVARELPRDAAMRYLRSMLDATCVVEHPRPAGPGPPTGGMAHGE